MEDIIVILVLKILRLSNDNGILKYKILHRLLVLN